jgi:hypothetical protein
LLARALFLAGGLEEARKPAAELGMRPLLARIERPFATGYELKTRGVGAAAA